MKQKHKDGHRKARWPSPFVEANRQNISGEFVPFFFVVMEFVKDNNCSARINFGWTHSAHQKYMGISFVVVVDVESHNEMVSARTQTHSETMTRIQALSSNNIGGGRTNINGKN